MLVATFKLSTHTKFWSFLLVLSILVLSLGLYVAYMWISNYYFSDYVKGTTFMFYTSGETYFLVLFCVCAVLALDGVVLAFDQEHSGLLSKVRKIVEEKKEHDAGVYERESVGISVNTRV
jgi:phospholipid-transporting ATPase